MMNKEHTNNDEHHHHQSTTTTVDVGGTTSPQLSFVSACPYAAALNWNASSDTSSDHSLGGDSVSITSTNLDNAVILPNEVSTTATATTTTKRMIQSCPAFQNGHCPFASCTNEHEIRKMLLQIPSSHYYNTTSSTATAPMTQTTQDVTTATDNDKNEKEEKKKMMIGANSVVGSTTTTTAVATAAVPTTTPFLQVLQELHSVAGTIAHSTTTNAATTMPWEMDVIHQNGSINHHPPSKTTTTTPKSIIPNKCPIFHATTNSRTNHNNHNNNSTTTTGTTTTTTGSAIISSSSSSSSSSSGSGSSTSSHDKFTHVIMDGYSLSEIMARLAKELEEEEEEEEARREEMAVAVTTRDATSITPTATTTTTDDVDNNLASLKVLDTMPNDDHVQQQQEEEEEPTKTVETAVVAATTTTTRDLLSATMKHGTAASHIAAENVYFVRNFIRGQIDPILFAELTCQLYYVYDTLEYYLLLSSNSNISSSSSSSSSSSNVHLQQFRSYHTQLQRTESLKEDLDYWFGTKKAEHMMQSYNNNINNNQYNHSSSNYNNEFVSPATKDYLERIEYCATHDPYLLLAHSYTRYLGDLSGGKILARVARKALQLSNTGEGLTFYDFTSTIQNTKQFKDQYRNALDNLDPPLTTEQVQLLVAEANIAFVLNMRIFEELDVKANIPNAVVRPLVDAIQPYIVIPGSTNTEIDHRTDKKEIPKECPFANMNQTAAVTTTLSNLPKKEIPKECPFANMNQTAATTTRTSSHSTTTVTNIPPKQGGRCPWPFVIFHDPKQALQDWQTWMLFGLILCWLYHQLVLSTTV